MISTDTTEDILSTTIDTSIDLETTTVKELSVNPDESESMASFDAGFTPEEENNKESLDDLDTLDDSTYGQFTTTQTPESELEDTTFLSNSCEQNGLMYADGESVPAGECQENCMCTNSEIHCQTKSCPPIPPSFLKCTRNDASDSCCPSYNCRE